MNAPRRVVTGPGFASAVASFFFAATLLVSAATVPPRLAAALVREDDVAYCLGKAHAASSVAFAQANYQFSNVTLSAGPKLVVLSGGGSCQCGNANCKLEVFRQNGESYVSVLSTYSIRSDVRPDGVAVIDSHDSANVSVRTTYRWNGSKYAVDKDELVLEDPQTVKPESRTVRFAPGTSEATLTGDKVQAGFDDYFDFEASAGQTVTLTLLQHDQHFGSFALNGVDGTQLRTSQGDAFSFKLPASGSYRIDVSGADQTFTSYSLQITVH